MLHLLFAVSLAVSAPPGFWAHWGDGKAELNGYTLTQQRYGETRTGQATLIFVTEDFSETFRVKAEPGKHAAADVFPVIKLNMAEDFQTGIYDYNVMTSVWTRVEAGHGMAAGAPVKMSFSSQEWCGHVFETWWFKPDGTVKYDRHSYFDGEADDAAVIKGGVTYGDTLFLIARGLAAGTPAPGKSSTIWYAPRLKSQRLLHLPLGSLQSTLTRAAAPETINVKAGAFETERFSVTTDGTTRITLWVERAAPRRIIAWEIPNEERAELNGSIRDAYWTHNKNGDEALLPKLGIRPQPVR